MLNSAVRFKNVYRFAYFLPNVTSVVAIAIVFGSVFSTNFGLMNALLQAVGLDQVAWLNTPWGIKVAIATLMTWQWTGYNAIIFLAGLQTVPSELYEAARVDGAGPVQMKKDVEALPGSSVRAIERVPFTCGVSLNSGASIRTYCCARCGRASVRVFSMPPCRTKPRTTRWKAVPS